MDETDCTNAIREKDESMRRMRGMVIGLQIAATTLLLTACGGGGGYGGGNGGGGYNPQPIITSPPSSTQSAFICPSTGANPQSLTVAASSQRRNPVGRDRARTSPTVPGLFEVVYASSAAATLQPMLQARATSLGGSAVRSVTDARLQHTISIVHVNPANASAEATLRALPGVTEVVPVRRVFTAATTERNFNNEPFFAGFTGATPPLYQTPSTDGQWDMHAIGLDYAFAYALPNNGSSITNPSAVGASSVKLAVIDTGADLTLPELGGGKVVHTGCFITDTNGNQSSGQYVTDEVGHGTDVAGIAAVSSNGYGFTGAGGDISLMIYRVFPTPDDNCVSPTSTDPQCGTTTLDIASAINDAVSNGANVINLSIGSSNTPCTTGGVDPDPTEGAAISNAIANNVIVVAASGNEGATNVDPPGCDAGVIAVGASALDDGQPNGSSHTGGTGANPIEYVANYSNDSSTNAKWGLVAPGGDASGASDADNLHWIENIWTSTPFDSNFAAFNSSPNGGCTPDVFGESGNCYTLIDGTSMSTPHVAGAAALLLSVNPTLQNPATMFQLLCSTADNISDPAQGCGELDVNRAMAQTLNDPNPPPPTQI